MEKEIKYEDAIKKLEEITKKLEAGRLPLEEALTCFAEGVNLIKICKTKLDGAKEKVAIISKDLEGNELETDFN